MGGADGLYYYGARWFDPSLGRFVQADTIIPGGVQGLDRYAYVNNNPLRYTDPTGHVACDEDGNCYNAQGWYRAPNAPRLSTVDTWKMMILGKFGKTMSDAGDKKWDVNNLRLVYSSLGNINTSLNGKIRSFSNGAVFKLSKHIPPADYPLSRYHGWMAGTTITFFTTGNETIRQMNLYHEFGHLMDDSNSYSDALSALEKTSFFDPNKYVDKSALRSSDVYDPTYGSAEAIQGSEGNSNEQWADIFANYVSGNIDMSQKNLLGRDMYNFVTDALAP